MNPLSSSPEAPPAATSHALLKTQPPATVAAGAPFKLSVVIVDNATNKTATSYNGPVTIALANNPGGAELTGLLTATAVKGVASFSSLSLDKVGTGYTIQAFAAGVTAVTTQAIRVMPGTVTKLVISSAPPTNIGAGSSVGVTVSAFDAWGNPATNFTGTVTASVSSRPTGAQSPSGTLSVKSVGGIATFSNIVLKTAGDYTLALSVSGAAKVVTDVIHVSAGTAATMVIAAQPPKVVAAGAGFGLNLSVLDAFGNVAVGFAGPLTATIAKNIGGGSLGGTTSVAVVNGTATFTDLMLSKVGNGYTLQVTGVGLKPILTSSFNVLPGAVDQFVVTSTPPSTINAGAKFKVVFTALDGYGNKATNFQGPVTLTLSSTLNVAVLAGSAIRNANAGVVTFDNLAIYQASMGYSLRATAGVATGSTATFDVVPLAAKSLTVRTQPPTQIDADASFDVVVAATDIYGNVATSFGGTAFLSQASNPNGAALSGSTTAEFRDGLASFTKLALDKAGAVSFNVLTTGLPIVTTNSTSVLARLDVVADHVEPLSAAAVTLHGGQFSPTATTRVTLTDSHGHDYSATVLSVEPTKVTFAAPFLLDFITGGSVAGSVTIHVQQPGLFEVVDYTAAQPLFINDLPQPSSAAGTLTAEVLAQLQRLQTNAIADYQKITKLARYSIDTAGLLSALQTAKTAETQLQSPIASLMAHTVASVNIGAANGLPVVLDSTSLRLLDRVFAAVFANLNEPPVLSAPSAASMRADSVGRSPPDGADAEAADDRYLQNIRDQITRTITRDFVTSANQAVDRLRTHMGAVVAVASVAGFILVGPEAVAAAGVLGAVSWLATSLPQLANSTVLQGAGNAILNGKARVSDFRETYDFAKASAWSALQTWSYEFVGEHAAENEVVGITLGRLADSAVAEHELFVGDEQTPNRIGEQLAAQFNAIQDNAVYPPSIGLSNTGFTFLAPAGGPPPSSQYFVLSNTGDARSILDATSTVSGDAPSAVQLSGISRLAGGQATSVAISVSTWGLAKGTYVNTVQIVDAARAPAETLRTLTVTIQVVEPVISISPANMTFTVIQGQMEQTQALYVSNSGPNGSLLSYLTSTSYNYVQVSGSRHALAPGQYDYLTVTTQATNRSVGSYTDYVFVVDSNSGSYKYLTVTINVQAPPLPAIGVGATDVYFTATQDGPSPAAQVVTISNVGAAGSTLYWAASLPNNRYSLTNGVSPLNANYYTTATLSVNTSGLAANKYLDTITVYSTDDARVTSRTIYVHITINSPSLPAWGAYESGDNGRSSDQWYSITSAQMTVRFFMQPFGIPDRFVVTDDSGHVYADFNFSTQDNGFEVPLSQQHPKYYDFNKPAGVTRLRVQVIANTDNSTGWWYKGVTPGQLWY